MGLFSNLRAGKVAVNHKEQIARAVLTIPVLTAAADGQIDDIEGFQLTSMAAFNPSLVELGGATFQRLIGEIARDIQARGFEPVFHDAAPQLQAEAAHTAIAFAVRIAMADGVLDDAEKKILVFMMDKLNISDDAFVQILNTMRIMQARFA